MTADHHTHAHDLVDASFRLAVEALPCALLMIDGNRTVVLANQHAEHCFGWSRTELLGRAVDALIAGDGDDVVPDLSATPSVPEPPRDATATRRDGSTFPVQISASLMRAANGPFGLIAITDVSARRRAESARGLSERKVRAVFDQTFEFIGLLDPSGLLLEVNASAMRFVGVDRASVVGRPFWDTPWWTHSPEEQERLRQAIKRAAAGVLVRFETTHHDAQGDLRVIDFSLKPVHDASGSVVWLVPEGRDVTDRKRVEDHLAMGNALRDLLLRSSGDEVFAGALDLVRARFESPHGSLGYVRAIDGVLVCPHVTTTGGGAVADDTLLPQTSWGGLWERVLRDRRALVENQPASSPSSSGHDLGPLREMGAPLLVDGVLVGAIHVAGRSRDYTAADLAALEQICAVLAPSLSLWLRRRDAEAERERALQGLRASEAYKGAIVDGALDCIISVDEHGRILDFNPAAERTFGFHRNDVVGRTLTETIIPESLHERHLRGFAQANVAGAPAVGRRRELTGRRADGTEFPLEVAVIRLPGAPARYTAFLRDLTDRTRVEARALAAQRSREELIATIDGIVWEADATTLRFSFVSKQAERLLGFPASRWLEEPSFWVEHIHPEDREQAVEFRARQTRARDHSFEYRMLHADGGTIWVRDIVSVVAEDGRPTALRGIIVDITERKAAEAEHQRLETQLRQAQKMEAMGTLAGGIAHDFNNILGAMLGNVELARSLVGPEHAAGAPLDEIQRSGLRAAGLIRQILTFSRQERAEQRVVSLHTIVEEAGRLLRAALPAGVELIVDLAPCPEILADPTEMHQVLMNLCTNAWQAMEGGPGRVTIRVETAPDGSLALPGPGQQVLLTIVDTGKGIPATSLERIFEPFFTTKGVGDGTGLGLFVVHGIVKRHQGAIDVTSEPARGTTVRIWLPAAAQAPCPSSAPASSPAPAAGDGQHLLYIDDEAPMVAITTRLLNRHGYTVSGFTSSKEGLAAFRADPSAFDAVVTDFNMPEVSGVQVAREVRALRPDVPVMLVSGFITDELRDEVIAAGAAQVLYKPYRLAELLEAVRRLLSTPT